MNYWRVMYSLDTLGSKFMEVSLRFYTKFTVKKKIVIYYRNYIVSALSLI